MKFKGFDGWIEIFRGGKQIDSQGRSHDGDGLIEKAINSFDPKVHEPPVVVGHPKDNTPAFGWIAGLKKIGNVLHAKIKDVVPEFKKAVKAGLYKKRSASFYPDGRLRHVGFLGAAPPAVKGLADLKFEGDGGITFNDLTFGEEPKTFTGADVEAAKKEAAEAERKKVEAEFAEKTREETKEARDKEIVLFVEAKVKEGVLPPAIANNGLVEFMQSFDDIEFEFSEGQKANPVEFMKSFLDQLGKFNIFTEIATKQKAFIRGSAEADEAMGREIAEKVNQE